jgi:hypothetical protein
MYSLHVYQDLLMGDHSEFHDVSLLDANIGGQVDLDGSKVTGTLDMDSLQAEALFMRDVAEFHDIILRDARIGGQLGLDGSKVTGTLDMTELRVGSGAFLRHGAEFDGPIIFYFGKVGTGLDFSNGLFKSTVDLTAAQIGGDLVLGSSRDPTARWAGGTLLILRNAKADAIQDLSNSWPDKLDLNGFNYRSLGGIFAAKEDPMISRSVAWFDGWLGKQEPYTPAPYEQLAKVLRDEGRPEAADNVLYAGKERERAQSAGWRYIWMTANKWVIGYGYHLERAFWWVFAFVAFGIEVLWMSGEGQRNGMPYGIAYSFDLLLPIIQLRERHYKIDLGLVCPVRYVRYYFYLHKIAGFVLASFLIAGISGLTK